MDESEPFFRRPRQLVDEGQPLFTIESPDADAATSGHLQAEATVTQARATLLKAQADVERTRALLEHNAIAKNEVLNADTVVPLGATRVLSDWLDAHPTTALIGPRLRHPDGTEQPSRRRGFAGLARDRAPDRPRRGRIVSVELTRSDRRTDRPRRRGQIVRRGQFVRLFASRFRTVSSSCATE